MNFGENLKLIRKAKKISQEDLAYKLNVSRQSVSKWETGENYPSMSNILYLCDIFNCKINELVHEDFTDINSLDDEIKMRVVKFKEKEQIKMKGLSKAIYIIARILKIVPIIGIITALIFLSTSPIVISNTKFDLKNQVLKIYDNEFKYNYIDNKLRIDSNNKTYEFEIESSSRSEIDKFISKSNFYKISFIVILSLSIILSCFFLYKMIDNLEKLFINIHDNSTPFNSDNVNFIKKIALYLTLFVFIPDFIGSISILIFNLKLGVEINLIYYLFVIVILAISYIFKYGYEIQLDSNGRIYG